MKSLVAAAALVLLLPALALAQKTSFDFDKTADFSKFKTYTLKDGTKVGDPLIDNRIVAAIEAELAAKGLTKSDADAGPCRRVPRGLRQDSRTSLPTPRASAATAATAIGMEAAGVRPRPMCASTRSSSVRWSSMSPTPTKKEVVWRGMGVKEVDVQAKADKRDKNINGAVKKILKDFPPKKKS